MLTLASFYDDPVALDEEEREFCHQLMEEEMNRRYEARGEVHENLRKFRLKRKLKKHEMATLMEVTPRTYYSYEEGKRSIPSDALAKLAVRTGGDLNVILLGRPAEVTSETATAILNEFRAALKYLDARYSDMKPETKGKIAYAHAAKKFGRDVMPEAHDLTDTVKIVTGYRTVGFPAPPFWEDYGDDQEQYEKDDAAWQAMVDEELGTIKKGPSAK